MNDFARLHNGDNLFKKIMVGAALAGTIFALYMGLY